MGKVIVHHQVTVNGADGVGPIRLHLVSATPYRSGVVWLRYQSAAA